METHSDDIKATDGEQSEADHEETGHCAAAECHAQGGLAVLQSPRSGTDIGHHGDTHADVSGGERTDRTEKESKRNGKPLHLQQNHKDHHGDDRDRRDLAVQVGLGPLLDGGRDLEHFLGSLVRSKDVGDQENCHHDAQGAAEK